MKVLDSNYPKLKSRKNTGIKKASLIEAFYECDNLYSLDLWTGEITVTFVSVDEVTSASLCFLT